MSWKQIFGIKCTQRDPLLLRGRYAIWLEEASPLKSTHPVTKETSKQDLYTTHLLDERHMNILRSKNNVTHTKQPENRRSQHTRNSLHNSFLARQDYRALKMKRYLRDEQGGDQKCGCKLKKKINSKVITFAAKGILKHLLTAMESFR